MYLTIGSGDIKDLLSGFETKAYNNLWDKFKSENAPMYNALNSPIDQLRTGAILENVYYKTLPDSYMPQYKVLNKKYDCFKATLDFADLQNGLVIDFEELKSIAFEKYKTIEKLRDTPYNVYIEYIKKKHKIYYNQIQSQLFASGLDECTLTFVVVYDYIDEINESRVLSDNEYIKFRIKRDDDVINMIKYRLTPFQQFKDFHTKK